MNIKKPLIATAAFAVVSTVGLGASAYAVTDSSNNNGSSIVNKIAEKFNLNKDEVKEVFTEEKAERTEERKAEQVERLATAVEGGDLTQAQSDYITKALAEIESLRSDTSSEDKADASREETKAKMDALRDWATENEVDKKLVGHAGGHGRHGGPDKDRE
jgi:hypothetical protein